MAYKIQGYEDWKLYIVSGLEKYDNEVYLGLLRNHRSEDISKQGTQLIITDIGRNSVFYKHIQKIRKHEINVKFESQDTKQTIIISGTIGITEFSIDDNKPIIYSFNKGKDRKLLNLRISIEFKNVDL